MNSPEMRPKSEAATAKERVSAESKLEKKGKRVAFDLGEVQMISDFEAQNKIVTSMKRELATSKQEYEALANSILRENLSPTMDDLARLEAVQKELTERYKETLAGEKQRAETLRQLAERNPQAHDLDYQVEASSVQASEKAFKKELERMEKQKEEIVEIIRERLFKKN
jgi:hypothetical protein